jgi:Heterokaryon incompatibility protein (HET)
LQCTCHKDDSTCKICKRQDRRPCALFHQNCHIGRATLPDEDPPLPNRVLDVGSQVNDTIRLFERDSSSNTCGSTTHARYVALSYCWGVKKQRCQTSVSNVDEFRVSIPWERVELSIQHAIQCTRSLGYRYLWVDCLCIVQDDERDKRACIAQLKDIFQNATVTLVAEAASSVQNGFLKRKIDIEQFSFQFHITEQRCSTVTLIPLADQDHRQRIGTRARAWCLEEFLLSPRKLIYSNEDIRWRCLTTECKPLGSGHIQHANELDQLPREVWDPENDNYFRSLENRSRLWMTYVDEYSSRQLTQPQDGPRAIAGIGHRLAGAFGDTYVQDWGIFENALECGFLLSWSVLSPQAKRFPLAPSWSWLSVKHESRISFLKPIVFNAGFGAVLDSNRPGVLNVYAVVIKLWELSRTERDQIVFHRDSRCCRDSVSRRCFLLMFDYRYDRAYSGLAIRPFKHKQYGKCWQRIALFERRLSDSRDNASRSPELSQGPALSPPDSDDDQNECLDDARRDEERECYEGSHDHSRSSQEILRSPGISHLFREIKLV